MNLKQWQRSEKIKAEAEAAAKRTIERVLNAVKEPAMSEFKVGDWVKMKDDSSAWMGRVEAIEYKPCFDSKWNRYEIEILVFEDGKKLGSEWAIHVVKAAGHRIDMPSLPEPVGSLQELHPEFAKVLHENFLELLGDESNTVQVAKDAIEHGNDLAMVSIEGVEHVSIAHVINPFPCKELGDDFPIENHISPLCKSKDV